MGSRRIRGGRLGAKVEWIGAKAVSLARIEGEKDGRELPRLSSPSTASILSSQRQLGPQRAL